MSQQANATQDEIEALHTEHQTLKARLKELTRHVSLTSSERLEVSELKKRKLMAKDKIFRLRQSLS